MNDTFTVLRPSQGLVASLHADRFALDADAGADPNEGGDGGSPPPDDGALFDDPEDGDRDGDRAARSSADDGDDERDEDDDDEDDARYEGLPEGEQIKRLRGALKKAKKKLSKRTPVFQQVEALARRGVTLDDLLYSHRAHRELAAKISQNPQLRALFEPGGHDAPARRPSRGHDRRVEDENEFQFDDSEEALGFDKNANKTNRVLAEAVKRSAYLEWQLQRLQQRIGEDPDKVSQRVEGLERTLRQSAVQSIEREWGQAVTAACAHITDPDKRRQNGLRTVFRDAMRAAMERYGGRKPPQDFVRHYFAELGIKPSTAARATTDAARAAHRTAERVSQLQRQPSQPGQPAPARAKKELLGDVHRRIKNLTAGAR